LDPRECEAIAQRVDEVARPFSGERGFEYWRATAWCQTALAQTNDFVTCEVEGRRRDAQAVRDLTDADIGIGKPSVSFGGRPPVRPARRAAARPAWVRSRIMLRSNSASAPNM
jgi:hypothetical protein